MQRGMSKRTTGIFILAVALCLGVLFTAGCVQPDPTPSGNVDCSGAKMLDQPAHLDEMGNYPVASRYVFITNPRVTANNFMFRRKPFRVQIVYPTTEAELRAKGLTPASGTSRGDKKEFTIEDLKWYIPDIEPIPGTITPTMPTDCYELPNENLYDNDHESDPSYYIGMDTTHGPYPVIFLVHGTSSSSICHLTESTHWASRGFVVLVADYNGINMRDMMKNFMAFQSHQELPDTRFLVEQVKGQSGVFSMLKGHIDTNRMGISGHSWGGQVTCDMSGTPGIKVAIPMASVGVRNDTEIQSALIMGSQNDGVLNYRIDTVNGYNATKARKRFVGLPRCGHEAFVNFCDFIVLAKEYGVYLDPMIKGMALDGCNDPDDRNPKYMNEDLSMDIIKYATAGAFEETLQCSADAGRQLDNIEDYFRSRLQQDHSGQTLDYRYSDPTPNNTSRMPFVTDGLEMLNILFGK